MTSFLLLGLASLMALAACTLLALSQSKHVITVFGRKGHPPFGGATRATGWALLATTLVPCLLAELPGFAVLFWLLSVLSSALAVALLIAFKPSLLTIMRRISQSDGQITDQSAD